MTEGKILIVDNDRVFMNYIRDMLSGKGYDVDTAGRAEEAVNKIKLETFNLAIIKEGMPGMEGLKLVKELKAANPDITVILSRDKDSSRKAAALPNLEIYDYLVSPINPEKAVFIIDKGIELNRLSVRNSKVLRRVAEENTSLQKQNALLTKRIEESTKNLSRLYENLRDTYLRTIKALAQAIDTRDHYTGSHSANVARYAAAIAEAMHLSTQEVEAVREACELHDLGKVGIQDYILSKPTKLTPEEWEQMKEHPMKGAQILEHLTFLGDVVEIVREHHEHYDGTGYPFKHKGDEIPLGARIVCLADSYDAMTSARSYRKSPLTKEEAVAEIVKNSGKQFDPRIVEAFLKVVEKF